VKYCVYGIVILTVQSATNSVLAVPWPCPGRALGVEFEVCPEFSPFRRKVQTGDDNDDDDDTFSSNNNNNNNKILCKGQHDGVLILLLGGVVRAYFSCFSRFDM
jgi:hypothetical protein